MSQEEDGEEDGEGREAAGEVEVPLVPAGSRGASLAVRGSGALVVPSWGLVAAADEQTKEEAARNGGAKRRRR